MNEDIKNLYKMIIKFEERLEKEPISISLKTTMSMIRNKYSDIFEQEIYEALQDEQNKKDIPCPHCGISRLEHYWIDNDNCMAYGDE